MSAKPFFSGRIPQELYDQIEKHVAETGESKTSLLIRALASCIGLPVQNINSITSIDLRMTAMEQKILSLENLTGEIAEIKQLIENASESTINSDNSFDNTNHSDQLFSPGQLSFLALPNNPDNVLNNVPDNSLIDSRLTLLEAEQVATPSFEEADKMKNSDNANDNANDNDVQSIQPRNLDNKGMSALTGIKYETVRSKHKHKLLINFEGEVFRPIKEGRSQKWRLTY